MCSSTVTGDTGDTENTRPQNTEKEKCSHWRSCVSLGIQQVRKECVHLLVQNSFCLKSEPESSSWSSECRGWKLSDRMNCTWSLAAFYAVKFNIFSGEQVGYRNLKSKV